MQGAEHQVGYSNLEINMSAPQELTSAEIFASFYPHTAVTETATLEELRRNWDTSIHFLNIVYTAFQAVRAENPDEAAGSLVRAKFILLIKPLLGGWDDRFVTFFSGREISSADLETFMAQELDIAATELLEEEKNQLVMVDAAISLLKSDVVNSFSDFVVKLIIEAEKQGISRFDFFHEIDLWFSPVYESDEDSTVSYECSILPDGEPVYDFHIASQAAANPRKQLFKVLHDLQEIRCNRSVQRQFKGAAVRGISWLVAELRPWLLQFLEIAPEEITIVQQIDTTQMLRHPQKETNQAAAWAERGEILEVAVRNLVVSERCIKGFIEKGKLPLIGVIVIPNDVFFRPVTEGKLPQQINRSHQDNLRDQSQPHIWNRVMELTMKLIKGF